VQNMDQLQTQVRRVRRRLGLQRFVGVLGWCWFATLLVALGLILADRYRPLGVEAWNWGAGALVLGLAAAAVWTFATRRSALAAAVEIDRRFALKERVSSTLAMPSDQHMSAAGQALLADAAGRLERIDVPEKFAFRPPRQILLPLLPGVPALLVAWLISPAVVNNPAAANAASTAVQQQVQQSAEALHRKLAERRQEAEKLGLKEAERLLKQLEAGSQQLLSSPPERKQALIELNDLARQLQMRRQQLQAADKFMQQLEQLKNIQRGPAEKFVQAMSKGDLKRAAEELQKIKDQLSNSKLSDEQKADLAKQLEQMQEKLNKLAEAQKAAQEDLQKRIEQMRQAGQQGEAGKLQEQLEKLLAQAPQVQQLNQLAEKLGQCAKCLQNGQLSDAENALDGLQASIGDLQKQLDELEMLDDAFDQLAQAKDRMTCPHCGGVGCEFCQGDQPGFGLGRGRGQGDRPEAKTDTGSYDSHVKQKVGEGSAVVVGTANGPNVKGNVQQEIQREFESAREGATDPLSGHRIPRKHRQHAQEYFDRFREGK